MATTLRLNISTRQTAYFYADDYADLYDATTDLTQDDYRRIHRFAVDLLQRHFAAHTALENVAEQRPVVLDLGAGTGTDVIGILRAIPAARAVALDVSPRMLAILRGNIATARAEDAALEHRYVDVLADMSESSPDELLAFIPSEWRSAPPAYAAVVAVFALHHFGVDAKRALYNAIFDVLAPGGIFINADLFSYQAPTLARLAEEHEESFLRTQFETSAVAELIGSRRDALLAAWIDHLRHENVPLPIEGPSTSEGAAGEESLLRDVGFSEIGCPYRNFQSGVLWAKK